ncbi:hypothetical protein [Haloplanus litoreus]|uniref:Uncharacterized protein n=1 Tax=Haloplanus litoreus TaxID=767515 RepID=A0ABD6A266_9EURY
MQTTDHTPRECLVDRRHRLGFRADDVGREALVVGGERVGGEALAVDREPFDSSVATICWM